MSSSALAVILQAAQATGSSRDIALAFVTAINQGDANSLRQFMTDDHTFTDALGNTFSGAEKMVSAWQHFYHAFPDYRIDIKRSFSEGSTAALFGEASGGWRVKDTVLPQRWRVNAAWLAQIESGRIKRWSVFCDTSWAKPPA